MSTKIHDGCRIKTTNLRKLHAFMLGMADRLRARQQELATERMAWLATEAIDAVALGTTKPQLSVTGESALHWVRAAIKKQTDLDGDDLDWTIGMWPQGSQVLAILFTGSAVLRQIWDSNPHIEPWGWWNNTDKPDEVSPRAWSVRRRAWAKALRMDEPGGGIPARTALEMSSLVKFTRPPSSEDIVRLQPSLAQRVSHHASEALFTEHCEGAKIDARNVMTFWATFRDRCHKDPVWVSSHDARIKAALKPALTFVDYLAPLTDEQVGDPATLIGQTGELLEQMQADLAPLQALAERQAP